jgi:SNF2 family DNA or RNA helicase
MQELPNYSISNVYVEFEDEQAQMYNATVESIKEYLIENIKSYKREQVINSFALSKFTYLREICDSTQLVSYRKYSGKMNKLSKIMNDVLPNKVVIFTEFAKMAHIIQDVLRKEHNCDVVAITGNDNSQEKNKKVEQFKHDDNVKVLVCTDVLKYGQNLQCAHYLINFDLPWNYATLEQRIGRERRVDQKHKVIVLNLIMKNSCEDRIMDILQYKRKLSNIIDDVKYDRIKVPKSKGITYKTLKELIK